MPVLGVLSVSVEARLTATGQVRLHRHLLFEDSLSFLQALLNSHNACEGCTCLDKCSNTTCMIVQGDWQRFRTGSELVGICGCSKSSRFLTQENKTLFIVAVSVRRYSPMPPFLPFHLNYLCPMSKKDENPSTILNLFF